MVDMLDDEVDVSTGQDDEQPTTPNHISPEYAERSHVRSSVWSSARGVFRQRRIGSSPSQLRRSAADLHERRNRALGTESAKQTVVPEDGAMSLPPRVPPSH